MVATGDFRLDGGRISCVPWQSLQPGAYGSFCAAFLPWTLAAYWLCSSLWHRPQSTRASFSGVRHFLDIAVAGHALEGAVGRRFQGRGIEPGGHSRLALSGPRTGIVAAGAVFAFWRGRLLGCQSGSPVGHAQ